MENLLKLAATLGDDKISRSLPPVEKWNPPYCGEMDMVIQRDGLWVHEKTPIGRPQLVQLFATILKREGNDYFLVTPVEKIGIIVEDVPFVITRMTVNGDGKDQILEVETNVGDAFQIGKDHKIEFRDYTPEGSEHTTPVPYTRVRRNLDARFARTIWYDLAELAMPEPESGRMGIFSQGEFFPLPS